MTSRGAFLLLAVLGCWAIAVPYLGPPLGIELDVASKKEVVDHVLPGALVLASAAVLLARDGRGTAGIVASAAAFLAGFWITATHVPLIAEAARGDSPWGATVWHNSAGLPVAALALAILLRLLAVED